MISPKTNSSNHAAPQTGGVRFAPSPTGRFHVGNLRTAWISNEFARALGVLWVVRFEDIDRPRVISGAQELQLADMKALGLEPDVVLLQSDFEQHHRELFESARADDSVYPCSCSRKEVQTALLELASASHSGIAPVYSGHCRSHPLDRRAPVSAGGIAWRFKMADESGAGDFIIARTSTASGADDGFTPAYHWACAIDDFDGAYNLIVRSADLATALPLQRAIQKWVAESEAKSLPSIRAFHTALVTQDDGQRLEKRTSGVTLHELFDAGWSQAKLLSSFDKSFDSSNTAALVFNAEGAGRESQDTIRLSDLLKSV